MRVYLSGLVLSAAVFCSVPSAFADQWTQPTAEELSMTSQAGAPNASAVILFHEETADDSLRMHSEYVRIKILSEEGKSHADVEIPFFGHVFSITDAAGRTIHSDGTVIPFTGKPYEKTIVKSKEYSYKAKVFTMPDVQVGSIIEYRYKLRYDDNLVLAPHWFIQSKLYQRQGHYRFVPSTHDIIADHGTITNGGSLMYYQNLPKGADLVHGQGAFELVVKDVPQLPDEDYLPPLNSFSDRVIFFYSGYHDQNDFWKTEGKFWSKDGDSFINAKGLHDAVSGLTASTDSPDQKLRKIYAAVQALENTDYTHRRDAAEEKADGLKTVKTSIDVWNRKRGGSDQLALLFVGMARATGFKAYRMSVVNRDKNIFNPADTEMSQLDDDIAIVEVDGKELFFDPGAKYCPYGQMHWKHTLTRGLRQMPDGSTNIGESPSLGYKDNIANRIAQLTLAEDGSVSGPVRLSYTGDRALDARQSTIERDPAEREKYFEDELRDILPGGLEIHLVRYNNLEDIDKPFVLDFSIKGPIGTVSSKRLLLPQSIFQVNEKQLFTAAKRTNPVYFKYPYRDADLVQVTLPADVKVDSLPKTETTSMKGFGVYATADKVDGNKLILQRELVVADTLETAEEYPKLKDFFGTVRSRDEDQALLSRTPTTKAN